MSLQIEEGKYYRDGEGHVIGPMEPFTNNYILQRQGFIWKSSGAYPFSYTAEGSFSTFYSGECDLIREVNADGSEIISYIVPDPAQRFHGLTAWIPPPRASDPGPGWNKLIAFKEPVCDCGSKHNSGIHSTWCSTLENNK